MLNGGVNATDTNIAVACQSWTYSSAYANASGSAPVRHNARNGRFPRRSNVTPKRYKVTYTHKFIFATAAVRCAIGIAVVGRQRMINEPFGPC
jgi:hypothetical protein